ncbi:MAG: RNA 2',3'-cyclic phosphodiesterase [Gammaproteobacteria bacterium]|nr:MAG: RNA 2',3'-cyclic phosphodiesterase [Gammaproteobacteria bacterium]
MASRYFFALWPGGELREALEQWLRRAGKGVRARRVPPSNYHITLVYLGPLEAGQLACLREAAGRLRGQPFVLTLDHGGWWRRPQVGWVGVARVPDALTRLQEELDSAARGCGLETDERPYVPHLTVLRKLRQPFPLRLDPVLEWPVRDFVLVESADGGNGAEYRVLERWPLVPPGEEGGDTSG